MKTLTLGCAIVCALFITGASGHAAGTDISFDVQDATEIFPNAIDSNGNVAGYIATTLATGTEKNTLGFLRDSTTGNITTFSTPAQAPFTSETVVWGMNSSGIVVGEGYYDGGTHKGFARSQDGLNFTLMDIAPGGGTGDSSARAINDNGVVVGSWSAFGSPYKNGFVLSGGVFTSFLAPNPSHKVITINTIPTAVDSSGNIAGTFDDSTFATHVFLRPIKGRLSTFDIPGATSITVTGLNDNGLITGHYSNGSVELAFTITTSKKSVTTSFADPQATTATLANSLNFLGTILGSYSDGTNYHGFTRDSSGNFADVNMGGTTISTVPLALNGNNVITGYFIDATGAHGFIR